MRIKPTCNVCREWPDFLLEIAYQSEAARYIERRGYSGAQPFVQIVSEFANAVNENRAGHDSVSRRDEFAQMPRERSHHRFCAAGRRPPWHSDRRCVIKRFISLARGAGEWVYSNLP